MTLLSVFIIKIKNTLLYRHNLALLIALPALAVVGAWALLTFYIEGGASIPVGVLDYDKTEFSRTAIARFAQKSTVGVIELETGEIMQWAIDGANSDTSEGLDASDDEDNGAGGGAGTNGAADTDGGAGGGNNAPVLDEALQAAARLIQTGALEAVLVVNPGFSDNLYAGEPDNVFAVYCLPGGIARGIVAELFAAQVSRLYFNCDSASRVVRDAASAARSARRPALTDDEIAEIFDAAYAFCDAYWEPEPLMTVEYERYEIPPSASASASTPQSPSESPSALSPTSASAPEHTSSSSSAPAPALAPPGSTNLPRQTRLPGPLGSGEWEDLRAMLNDLIARGVFAIFFTYAAFCVINATGVMARERSDGVLTRMRAHGFGAGKWIAISAAAPFILYGVPCAALLSYLTGSPRSAVFAFASLICVSTLGACCAYILKNPRHYRAFTLVCVIFSTGASLYFL
ncbi:MAG: hypothetical protein FWH01_05930 [Oscillospiraceae bacterium]|nr:hypothetical protein [Oscillospiraceae bacterium]